MIKHQFSKPWRTCVKCGKFARFTCAHCSHIKHQDTIPYCSGACQREDWPSHKRYCQRLVENDAQLSEGIDGDILKWTLKERLHKIRLTWMLDNSWLMPCTVRRAAFSSKLKDAELPHHCFHITMIPFDPNHPHSPLLPISFEWKPMTDVSKAKKGQTWTIGYPSSESKAPVTEEIGTYYQITINGSSEKPSHIKIVSDRQGPSSINAQWPWIFSHCVAIGDIIPEICTNRMDLLSSTLNEALPTEPRLRQFAAKDQSNRVDMTRESFDARMELMYPVTSSIRTKIPPACNFIAETYRHFK